VRPLRASTRYPPTCPFSPVDWTGQLPTQPMFSGDPGRPLAGNGNPQPAFPDRSVTSMIRLAPAPVLGTG